MQTALAVRRELDEVRARLARAREQHDDKAIDILWGAQQALGWVLGELHAMSTLADIIEAVTDDLTAGH